MPANCSSSAERPVALPRIGHPSPLLSAFSLVLTPTVLALVIASCTSSRASDSIAIVQAAYDRLAEGDVDGYLAYFADDAIFLDEQGHPIARDAVRERLTETVATEQ